jgi:SEL1 protein
MCRAVLCCAVPCYPLQGIKPDRQREVLQYYQYSADRGNVDAQTAVGTLLNIGTHGVVRDHAAAAHYLQRAAASGSAEAMAHLGHMYGSGMGVATVSVRTGTGRVWWVSSQQWLQLRRAVTCHSCT